MTPGRSSDWTTESALKTIELRDFPVSATLDSAFGSSCLAISSTTIRRAKTRASAPVAALYRAYVKPDAGSGMHRFGAVFPCSSLAGTRISCVKPHGALGNLAARDNAVADAIVAAVGRTDPELAILAISGTCLENAAHRVDAYVYSFHGAGNSLTSG